MPFKNMPDTCFKLWEKVYNDSKDAGDSEEKAAKKAYGAIKNAGWEKGEDGKWHKNSFSEFSMRIDRASYDKATGERRVRIVASDTDEDNRKDNMSLELFNDFIERIKLNEPVPEEFQSEFWKSGEPYISVSHYPDANGKTVPGIIDATYMDGNYLKSKGKFFDTPLGRKCFEAICSDLYGDTKDRPDKVRVSIAFLDYKHQHKSNGFVFDRQNSKIPYCPECLLETLTGESQGKIFLRGQLIHEALTRVPVNTRTSMEVDKSMADKILTRKDDAASIVGEDLAEEMEKEAEVIGKSEALVIKSEDEVVEEAKTKEAPMTDDEQEEPCDDEVDEGCGKKKKEMKSEEVDEAKTVGGESYPASDFLVVEDPNKPSTWHLQVKKNGKPDHNLMGAAKAALTSPGGHRGNKYAGPDKEKAISKLKKLYASEKMAWESEVEESETKLDINEFFERLNKIESMIEKLPAIPEPEVVPSHPLDTYFSEFKSKFDLVINAEMSENEKLQSIQEPFNLLGSSIVDSIKSSVKPKEVSVEQKEQSSLVEALSQVMNPIAQKLDLVLTQLSTPPIERTLPAIPQRRSIPPSVIPQMQQQQVKKSDTPKLHELISKTV